MPVDYEVKEKGIICAFCGNKMKPGENICKLCGAEYPKINDKLPVPPNKEGLLWARIGLILGILSVVAFVTCLMGIVICRPILKKKDKDIPGGDAKRIKRIARVGYILSLASAIAWSVVLIIIWLNN